MDGTASLTETAARRDDLLIYDRGFPSFVFFFLHRHHQVNFLVRCKCSFNGQVKAFVASGKRSLVVKVNENDHSKRILASLRILRRAIPDLFLGPGLPGVVEKLIREFLNHVEPVRPGRKYPKNKRISPPKYRQSRMPVL